MEIVGSRLQLIYRNTTIFSAALIGESESLEKSKNMVLFPSEDVSTQSIEAIFSFCFVINSGIMLLLF